MSEKSAGTSRQSLSVYVVVPAYNEAEIITATLERIHGYFREGETTLLVLRKVGSGFEIGVLTVEPRQKNSPELSRIAFELMGSREFALTIFYALGLGSLGILCVGIMFPPSLDVPIKH